MSVVKMSRGYKTFGIRQLLLCLGSFLSPGQRECFSAEGTSFQREIGGNSEGVHRGPASQDFYLLVC